MSHAVAHEPKPVAPPPARSFTPTSRILVQRKCACGGTPGADGECENCKRNRQLIQRRAAESAAPAAAPESVHRTLSSPGRPLDTGTRDFMESRFGHDFSQVRVHTDSQAGDSARAINAHAYTAGNDIAFAPGKYQPDSHSGRHLLAHELAHTVQQSGLQRRASDLAVDTAPDSRLEHEAESAAHSVMNGSGTSGIASRLAVPTMSRANQMRIARAEDPDAAAPESENEEKPKTKELKYETKTYNKKFTLSISSVPVLVEGSNIDASPAQYEIDKLVLPPQKGPYALDFCNKPYKPLQAKLAKSLKPIGNVPRDDTDKLRRSWLEKYGMKYNKEAHTRWKLVGGGPTFPTLKAGPTCEIDHMQELQVGGDNQKENLQVLDKLDNGVSGNLIRQQVESLGQAALADAKLRRKDKRAPSSIQLTFKAAEMPAAGICNECCELAKRFINDQFDPSTAAVIEVDYTLSILGKSFSFKTPADRKPFPLSGVPGLPNVINGLTFVDLVRGPKNKDYVEVTVDDNKLALKPGKTGKAKLSIGPDGAVIFSKNLKPPLDIDAKNASPGSFDTLTVESDNARLTGSLMPTVKFLPPKLDIFAEKDRFGIVKKLDKEQLGSTRIPGFRLTDGGLELTLGPKLAADGFLNFAIGGNEKKPLADGMVKIGADAGGLMAEGDIYAHLPGADEAKIHVENRNGKWLGSVNLEASKFPKLPFVKGGGIKLNIDSSGLQGSGRLDMMLPGENPAKLELGLAQGKWLFRGEGQFQTGSQYLEPFFASITYDGNLLHLEGKAGFQFKKLLKGTVDAVYEHRNGKDTITGKGNIDIATERATGNIEVELLPSHKLKGSGQLSYKIRPDLIASAGIKIDENQKITFDGALSLPDIQLFKRIPERDELHEIFSASVSIPIPGASIGNIGLQVVLSGSLGYYWYVGPGKLTEVKATVQFSPFEENPDFRFTLHAKASIPAGGGISGKITGDVEISAYVGRVGGGLSVTATAGLEGKAELVGDIAYSKDKFSVDASAAIGGGVILTAKLDAHVYAEAGVWKFKVRTVKYWELGQGTFDPGLKLGVKVPLHYDSIKGFSTPSLADIKPDPEKLALKPSSMLSSLMGQAKTKEEES